MTELGRDRPKVTLLTRRVIALASTLGFLGASAPPSIASPIPSTSEQLIVVSSSTSDPADHLATFQAYERQSPDARWDKALGPWKAEIGFAGLLYRRREGDGSTPIGVFAFGTTIYGNKPDPGGLHYRYHRLRCGDWWDEDPYSRRYNRFAHVPCQTEPSFARRSEALWTETVAYPYLAVIRFNMKHDVGGPSAPGSGIFLHSWVGGATNGCVALHEHDLITALRWLRSDRHPVIEIGIALSTIR